MPYGLSSFVIQNDSEGSVNTSKTKEILRYALNDRAWGQNNRAGQQNNKENKQNNKRKKPNVTERKKLSYNKEKQPEREKNIT